MHGRTQKPLHGSHMEHSPRTAVPDRNPRPSAQPQRTGAEVQLVRVWFGHHIVCEYADTSDRAERYAEAMSRRFRGLNVTIERDRGRRPPPLPAERMWELVPR